MRRGVKIEDDTLLVISHWLLVINYWFGVDRRIEGWKSLMVGGWNSDFDSQVDG